MNNKYIFKYEVRLPSHGYFFDLKQCAIAHLEHTIEEELLAMKGEYSDAKKILEKIKND